MKQSAFSEGINWYKGNTHSHTTLSDGLATPEEQVGMYFKQGYSFLAITDHNFMKTHRNLSSENFILLPGWERDIPLAPAKCIHLVGLFPADIPPDAIEREPRGEPEKMTMQMLIDSLKIKKQFIILCHPVWSRMEPEEVRSLYDFQAIEIFNTGSECLCHEGHAEYLWDMLLRDGKHILGIACDDTHGKTEKDDHFGGWIMVKAKSLSIGDILDAIYCGKFYASSGPSIFDWGIEDSTVYFDCSACVEIHVTSYPPRGKAFFAQSGKMLTHLCYPLKGTERYIRIECKDENGKTAWTNPIYFENGKAVFY